MPIIPIYEEYSSFMMMCQYTELFTFVRNFCTLTFFFPSFPYSANLQKENQGDFKALKHKVGRMDNSRTRFHPAICLS
jgi:hypothetical protein